MLESIADRLDAMAGDGVASRDIVRRAYGCYFKETWER